LYFVCVIALASTSTYPALINKVNVINYFYHLCFAMCCFQNVVLFIVLELRECHTCVLHDAFYVVSSLPARCNNTHRSDQYFTQYLSCFGFGIFIFR
jgi:hypothetical protein